MAEVWIRKDSKHSWEALSMGPMDIEVARRVAAGVRAEGWDALVYVGRC
jgi:hypothetical protein